MTPEIVEAIDRARVVALRVIAHYGEERQRMKAVEEACEAAAAACRVAQSRLASHDEPDPGSPVVRALVDEIADLIVAASALPMVEIGGIRVWGTIPDLIGVAYRIEDCVPARIPIESLVAVFGPEALAEAINRKAGAMEDHMREVAA